MFDNGETQTGQCIAEPDNWAICAGDAEQRVRCRGKRDSTAATSFSGAWRHLGLYAYRVGALKRLAAAPPAPLELAEKLEQLRALHLGMAIAVGEALERPGPGVDTAEDLERVRSLLGGRS